MVFYINFLNSSTNFLAVFSHVNCFEYSRVFLHVSFPRRRESPSFVKLAVIDPRLDRG